jgi:hypothetical protein
MQAKPYPPWSSPCFRLPLVYLPDYQAEYPGEDIVYDTQESSHKNRKSNHDEG